MSSLLVVDRPLCCSSGVCGPDPDPVLARFANDLAWLESRGLVVERINASAEPERFLAQAAVVRVHQEQGNECLPVILVDGEIASSGAYPDRDELARLAGLDDRPESPESLFTPAVKELVSLGAAIAANCEPCFRFHYAQALTLGVTRDDMMLAVATAQAVKDTPAKAMLELADRYLSPKPAVPEVANGTGCCAGAATPEPPRDAGCCDGAGELAATATDGADSAPPSGCC